MRCATGLPKTTRALFQISPVLASGWKGIVNMKVEKDTILLAEDDDNHVALIRRAFQKAGLINPIQVVHDGEEAIAYLKGEGAFANRAEYPLPTLLLLDLKMPRKNGFEVLRWIRQQPTLAALRIVVLTSSQDIRDVNQAYQLGANSFLVKTMDFVRSKRAGRTSTCM